MTGIRTRRRSGLPGPREAASRGPRGGDGRSRRAPPGQLPLLVFLLVSSLAAPSAAPEEATLSEVEAVLAAGASGLALELVRSGQPAAGDDHGPWLAWERVRVAALAARREWSRIAERLARRPPGLPEEVERWAETEIAAALIARGDGQGARSRLRHLLWGPAAGAPDPEPLRGWRRMVVESYLADGRHEDAHLATLRYDLDYDDRDPAWRLLRARVLLVAGRAADVARLTEGAQTDGERAYSLVARARIGALTAVALFAEAAPLVDRAELAPDLRFRLWSEIARLAARPRNRFLRVRALEGALKLPGLAVDRRGGAMDGDALWDAYLEYAQEVGNEARLLVGRHAGWLALAREVRETEPVKARALYAHVARKGGPVPAAVAAERELVDLVAREAGAGRLLRELYLDSGRFPGVDAIPPPARLALAERVGGRLELAARLVRGLDAGSGKDATPSEALRRARILELSGHRAEAANVLRGILSGAPSLTPEEHARAVEIVFDLRRAGNAEAVVAALLVLAAGREPDPATRRELRYWGAESYWEAGRFAEAARHFLGAAGEADDPWGRLARVRASAALARAGRAGDARRVLRALLDETADPTARARIERALGRVAPAAARR